MRPLSRDSQKNRNANIKSFSSPIQSWRSGSSKVSDQFFKTGMLFSPKLAYLRTRIPQKDRHGGHFPHRPRSHMRTIGLITTTNQPRKTGRREVQSSIPGRACWPRHLKFSVVFSETHLNTSQIPYKDPQGGHFTYRFLHFRFLQ